MMSTAPSPLIPIDRDHLIDRAYWEPVNILRNPTGTITGITYDRFSGSPTAAAH